jgi:hypothetical protein
MAAGAVALALFGLLAHGIVVAMTLALLVGYLIFGSMVGLCSILERMRSSDLLSAVPGGQVDRST